MEEADLDARGLLTLVGEFKPLPVLGMVAVEVDERFVRRAEQGGGGLCTTELPDHRAAVVGPVLNLKVVVISFRRKVQKLNMRTYEKICKTNE